MTWEALVCWVVLVWMEQVEVAKGYRLVVVLEVGQPAVVFLPFYPLRSDSATSGSYMKCVGMIADITRI